MIVKAFILLTVFCLKVNSIYAQEIPLFESDEPLNITLIADVVALIEDKSDEPEWKSVV